MRLTVGIKIAVAFGLCVSIMVVSGGLSYRSVARFVGLTAWVVHTHEVLENLQTILAAVLNAQGEARGYLITGDRRFLDASDTAQRTAFEAIKQGRMLTADNPPQQARFDVLNSRIDARFSLMRQLNEVRTKKGAAAVASAWSAAKPDDLTNRVSEQLFKMRDVETRLLQQRGEQVSTQVGSLKSIILAGALLVALLTGLAGLWLHRAVTVPLAVFRRIIAKVGEGDLTQSCTVNSSDEFGELSQSLNLMVSGLKDLAGQTRVIAENLNSSTAQILASAQQQAASTAQQAAAVQQTNVTVQELSQSGIQISERATEVSIAAQATSKAAAAGIHAVQNTNRTMESIRDQAEAVAGNVVTLSERTQAVGEIIASVNDLAEQAHLLSLNAAIEAAAAGEHGRTFSVVASEIKNLADRSKEATIQVRLILGEIQKGINSSVTLTEEAVKRVESGKEQADLSARTIRELTEGVDHSIQAFQQIVAGTNQQRIGFEQVTVAIREISEASDRTACSVRQLEGASAHLTGLGHQLRTAVQYYRI
jgi:methyl-accepting chemotaxis protein